MIDRCDIVIIDNLCYPLDIEDVQHLKLAGMMVRFLDIRSQHIVMAVGLPESFCKHSTDLSCRTGDEYSFL